MAIALSPFAATNTSCMRWRGNGGTKHLCNSSRAKNMGAMYSIITSPKPSASANTSADIRIPGGTKFSQILSRDDRKFTLLCKPSPNVKSNARAISSLLRPCPFGSKNLNHSSLFAVISGGFRDTKREMAAFASPPHLLNASSI